MQVILFDTNTRQSLYPFSETKPLSELQIGILTIREKWELALGEHIEILTAGYLQPSNRPKTADSIIIDASLVPDEEMISHVKRLTMSEALTDKDKVLAGMLQWKEQWNADSISTHSFDKIIPYNIPFDRLERPWQIFQLAAKAINFDLSLIRQKRKFSSISSTNKLIEPGSIFIEEGAKVEHAFLNASTGPIYIAKNAQVMEGAMIRGPFALGEGAVVKMGATIYGATVIGAHSVVGGEVKNSTIMPFSNKGHTGYLGDSVIGSWCNIGAGSSNSNLKNSAGAISIVSHNGTNLGNAGIKCGLLFGDYSRCAVNTSFNTGTVVGVCANIFGQSWVQTNVPSFSWGSQEKYKFDKAVEHIGNWKKLKNQILSESEIEILEHLYKQSN